jgi:7-cyano-7-deazaguanine synthase
MKTALLLSGGMDSCALAWWLRPDFAITVDYGQLAARSEIAASAAICELLSIDHLVVHVDCSSLGSGDMAGGQPDSLAPASDWWPFRNQMLITFAGMKALPLGATRLLIGTVSSDGTHSDGRERFFELIGDLMFFQEGNLQIDAPAISMRTVELVRHSGIPASALAWAHSCHKSNVPCGQCRGCNKYFEVYHELGYDLDGNGAANASHRTDSL